MLKADYYYDEDFPCVKCNKNKNTPHTKEEHAKLYRRHYMRNYMYNRANVAYRRGQYKSSLDQ